MLVKIGNTDITPLINESSYKMDASESYVSWQDGNFREHRKYTRSNVKGSFDVVLGSVRGTTLAQLKALIDANTTNHLLTVAVWVGNKASFERITAYYSLDTKKRSQLADGSYLETITVKLEER